MSRLEVVGGGAVSVVTLSHQFSFRFLLKTGEQEISLSEVVPRLSSALVNLSE